MSFLLILFLALHPNTQWFTQATFPPEFPVLWSKSDQDLTSGETNLYLTFRFESPCHILDDKTLVPGTKQYFLEWCESLLENSTILPIEKICGSSFAVRDRSAARRRKRFIRSLHLAGLSFYRSLLGISSSRREVDPEEFEKLQNIFQDMKQVHSQMKIEFSDIKSVQVEFNKKLGELDNALNEIGVKVKRTEEKIQEINNWRQNVTKSFGPTFKTVFKLASDFSHYKNILNEVAREWSDGKLSLKLFDVFMISPHSPLVSEFRGSTPIGCFISSSKGIAHFEFKKKFKDNHIQLLKADPFTFYKSDNGSDIRYKMEYVGPKEVVLNSTSGCLSPTSRSGLIIFPSSGNCIPLNEKPLAAYWKKTCESSHLHTEPQLTIQLHRVDDYYYVYCSGHSIFVYGRLIRCPDNVFSVHRNETIEHIAGIKLGTILGNKNYHSYSGALIKKVNYYLMPKMFNLNFESIQQANECGTNLLTITALTVGITAFILVIFVSAFVYILWKRRNLPYQAAKESQGSSESLENHEPQRVLQRLRLVWPSLFQNLPQGEDGDLNTNPSKAVRQSVVLMGLPSDFNAHKGNRNFQNDNQLLFLEELKRAIRNTKRSARVEFG